MPPACGLCPLVSAFIANNARVGSDFGDPDVLASAGALNGKADRLLQQLGVGVLADRLAVPKCAREGLEDAEAVV